MPPPRKIYVPPYLPTSGPDASLRVQQAGYPSPFQTPTGQFSTPTDIATETAARIAADNAEATARGNADATLQANINAEATTRGNADTTLTNNLTTETTNRTNADTTLQTNINSEATARVSGDTAAHWMSLDFFGLPTADPGGGKVWLKAGNLHVGA